MITNQEAEFLLSLPKFIIENDSKLETKQFDQPSFWNIRYNLIGENNGDAFEFLWEIWQSQKNTIKLSLHHQDDETKMGLFRVDYNSGHNNPAELTESVPSKFHPFVGKHFSINEHHVHYHVEGYHSLAWALPITNDDFMYKEMSEQNIVEIVEKFGKTINLQTQLLINRRLL